MQKVQAVLIALMTVSLLSSCSTTPHPQPVAQGRRTAFLAFKDFSKFARSEGSKPGQIVLTSPEISAPVDWDELVVSWNVSAETYLDVEARAVYPDHSTKYFVMSKWSPDPAMHPRESVIRQRDADGNVKIDTLITTQHGGKVQLRLTMGAEKAAQPKLKFVGLSFCDSRVTPPAMEPNRAAWGKTLAIPERHQGDYEGGGGWCSPTSLSMVLAYWGEVLHRPELNHTVPEVAHAINDGVYDGTGNWPFNTAYAGSFPGMRAYVTRMSDISELEDWIAAGVAPIVSVSSYLTHDRHGGQDNGHLIVCAGFTENGDFIANDPGASRRLGERPRRVYPRERFINAWKKSKFAVYLVYPESIKPPPNPLGDWTTE